MNNDELYHYGVPGMRWGKRKAEIRSDYKARIKKANGDYDKITQAKADYKKAKNALKVEKKTAEEQYRNSPEGQIASMKRKQRIGNAATISALAAIGTLAAAAPNIVFYKTGKFIRDNF